MITATQVMQKKHEDQIQEGRMKWMHEEFRSRYAPTGKRDRDEFEVSLAMLLRQVHIDATRPFQEAAAAHMAASAFRPQHNLSTEGGE